MLALVLRYSITASPVPARLPACSSVKGYCMGGACMDYSDRPIAQVGAGATLLLLLAAASPCFACLHPTQMQRYAQAPRSCVPTHPDHPPTHAPLPCCPCCLQSQPINNGTAMFDNAIDYYKYRCAPPAGV